MDSGDQWQGIAQTVYDALEYIDPLLAQENLPISKRKSRAFELIRETMMEISDYEAFLISDAHGRFLIIIGDWYEQRYGDVAKSDDKYSMAMVLIHETPFLLAVPHTFITPGEDNTQWLDFPASVQPEENPLDWIRGGPDLSRKSDEMIDELTERVTQTATKIRSIFFDVRSLNSETQSEEIRSLAASSLANLESAARYLCARGDADLGHAGSEISQSVEKALKCYIRRKGQIPKATHDLAKLAEHAERVGGVGIDRTELNLIPSGSDAASIRYEGHYALRDALVAYEAALELVKQIVYEARPELKYNLRQARFQIQTPPWFDFDTTAFKKKLKQVGEGD